MITKQITIDGNDYQIEIPRGGGYVRVTGIKHTATSGVLANAMEELTGRKMTRQLQYDLSADQRYDVILACGRKFSTAKAWRATYMMTSCVLWER